MLATNPKTGGQIRIIQSEASAWRDQKTVVWLDGAPQGPQPLGPWNRWEVGATSIAAASALTNAGIKVELLLALDDAPTVAAWLFAGRWASVSLVATSKTIVQEIGLERIMSLGIRNMLVLEELADLYPYTGHRWDGTREDAKALIALALRFGRSFPVAPSPERAAVAASRGLALTPTLLQPPPLWFVTQYYTPDKPKRRKEIQACLAANLACPLIDRVVLLNEAPAPAGALPSSDKLEEVLIGSRLTYAAVIRWAITAAPPDAILAFANADIFADEESWRLLWSVNLTDPARFFALLRWEVAGTDAAARAAAQLFGPRADSQDTWITSVAALRAAFGAGVPPSFEIPFGQPGCDNAITIEMFRKKFQVVNPAANLRSFHFHTSQIRTYDPRDIVDRPAYMYITPTGLQDMQPITQLPKLTPPFKPTPFDRPLKGPLTAAQAKTFCTMVARKTNGETQLDPDSPNTWHPAPVPLVKVRDAFQSREGLPFTYNTILVGPTKAAANAWGASQLSSLAASLTARQSVAAPLPNSTADHPGLYALHYLSKVLVARRLLDLPEAEFWCGRGGGAAEALRLFQWGTAQLPVMSRDETQQAWCQELGVWLPQDGPVGLVTREEVEALRGALGAGGWVEEADGGDGGPKIVIVVDDAWMTEEVAEAIEAANPAAQFKFLWAGRTNLEASVRALRGAAGLVLAGSQRMAPWAWVLPRGARVWEVQSEMEPSADLLHLCAAAQVEHRLCIVSKGAPTQEERAALVKKLSRSILEELEAAAPAEMPKPEGLPDIQIPPDRPPTILMPAGHQGTFAHAGDSFREMVDLWAEKGYVNLIKSPYVQQVWLAGKGGTLLYDRPTLEWLALAPKTEKEWKFALFGNPAPPGRAWGPAAAWTFWPRRPRLVEAAVARGLADTPFEARGRGLVFYGRSENSVQRGNRTKADWSAVCSEFIHVDGLSKYPFTQEEYLERLAGSRYGLCLAGYGRKCHREIECMAMGCVPVVAPEVDMENYADPPVVGTHYFRVNGPEEAAHVVQHTTPERWAAMSAAARAWWKHNASAEGSWELTRGLVLDALSVQA